MKKILKFFYIAVIIFVVLLVTGYFFITSSFLLKSIVLPLVGTSFGTKISAKELSISLINPEIKIADLSIEKTGEYSVKIKKFNAEFSLFDLIKNKITINSLLLSETYIAITNKITQEDIDKNKDISYQENSSLYGDSNNKLQLPVFNISNVKINNFNLKYHAIRPTAKDSSTSIIQNLNFEAPYFKSGGKGLIKFNGVIVTLNDNGSKKLTGNITGQMNAALNTESFPKTLELKSKLTLGDVVSPIELNFESKKDDNNKLSFVLKGNLENLPIDPFLSIAKSYQESGGKINSASIVLRGPAIQSSNLFKTLSGRLKAEVVKLYIPTELMNNSIGKLILLPVNIIAHSNEYLSSEEGDKVSGILNNSLNVIKGVKTMNFKKGNINISMNKGDIFISEFLFLGDKGSVVNKLSIQGSISRNERLNLRTETMITAVAIPINIAGTVKKPDPDIKRFLPALLGRNIINLAVFAKDGVHDIGEGFSRIGNEVTGSDPQPQKPMESETGMDEGSGKVVNTINKSLNNIIGGARNILK